jgi:hypothetical protein
MHSVSFHMGALCSLDLPLFPHYVLPFLFSRGTSIVEDTCFRLDSRIGQKEKHDTGKAIFFVQTKNTKEKRCVQLIPDVDSTWLVKATKLPEARCFDKVRKAFEMNPKFIRLWANGTYIAEKGYYIRIDVYGNIQRVVFSVCDYNYMAPRQATFSTLK